jgi:signal transduction histidine kinase
VSDEAPERTWNDDEVQALETAAEMVGSFLQRHETTAMLRRRIGELLTLNQIAQALAMWSDLDRGVEAIGGLVLQLFDAAAVAIWAYDQRADALRKIAAAGSRPQAAAPRTLPLAQSPAARDLLERKAATLARASADPLLTLHEHTGDDSALLLVPLLMYGTPVGVMLIAASRPGHLYTPSDIALAQTIAGGLATAIENGRLLATEQRQRRIAESLGRIAVELGRSLDHETVVGAIFTHLDRVLPNDGAAVFLHEENGLILAEGSGISLRHKGRHVSLADNPGIRRVCLTNASFVIGDTEASNEWTNWNSNVPIRSWAATPLRYGSESLGLLSVASLSPQAYDEDDVATLEAFATHAAIAIVNARRYGDAHRDAAEQVRKRLARDLHDSVSQAMLAATRTARVLPQLWELDPDDGRAALHDLITLIDGAQAEMRTLLLELRPTALARTPLDEALSFLVIGLAAKSGFALSHSLQRSPPLPLDVQVACYRIAQEALHNVVRHAQARQVHVQLEVAPCGHGQHALTLTVSDDGRGFVPERRRPGGIGIDSMLERAAGIGARIAIKSEPGQGARITLSWQGGCEPPEADGAIDERA